MNLSRSLLIPLALAACTGGDAGTQPECGPNAPCPTHYTCEPATSRCVRDGDVGLPDAGAQLGCPAPTAGPTRHTEAEIAADTVWSADGSPHIVETTLRLKGAATLTIGPCAQVLLAREVSIGAGGSSTLRALGTADRPITFGPAADGERWDDLEATYPASVELAHVTL